MSRKFILAAVAIFSIVALISCSDSPTGVVQDEAMLAGVKADQLKGAPDPYFADMDYGYLRARNPDLKLSEAEERGRNTWIVWTFGNDRFWDYMSNHTFGAFDLLKIVSSSPDIGYCTDDSSPRHEIKYDGPYVAMNYEACKSADKFWVAISRENRWSWLGVVNEPCFVKPTAPDAYGLWLDRRVPESAECPKDPFDDEKKYPGVKIGARGHTVPVGSYYGSPSGVVGLRLFPNPDFDDAAKRKWDARRYYTDSKYYNDQNLVRPYRVGMSCGFCHVGPNPIDPPADPNHPRWANLSGNVGAQYFWIDRIFMFKPDQRNFIWQLFHTSRPGTLDTSLVSTDSINNPRTMNALYQTAPRVLHAKRWGEEKLAGGELDNRQLNDYVKQGPLATFFQPPDTVWTPHVLKDGADSVGIMGALNRVYVNIGTDSEEWLTHFNPLVGGKPITPIPIRVARANSAYFAATENQTFDMARYLIRVGTPHHLADAPGGKAFLTTDQGLLRRGKIVFGETCARCHSSKLPATVAGLDPHGCAGAKYLECWNAYWKSTKTLAFKRQMREIVLAKDFLDNNYLSADFRVPVTLLHTNACSPLASNAISGNIWNDFSSESYKDLPSAGTITYYHPYTGETRTYTLPAGGRGYTRPPSLVSLWSTAPFLLNNSVGSFSAQPSVSSRMHSFEDSIAQMLWPERRERDALLGAKVPGKMDRTTAPSYITIAGGYLPEVLQKAHLDRALPALFNGNGVEIGPIPAGTPVNLIANLNVLTEKRGLEKVKYDAQLVELLIKIKHDLERLPKNATDEQARSIMKNLVGPLLAVSKCPDFIVNRGHYFGTGFHDPGADDPVGEPGLSDADKRALIEFLKTF